MAKWAKIESSPDYKALGASDQNEIKGDWFRSLMASEDYVALPVGDQQVIYGEAATKLWPKQHRPRKGEFANASFWTNLGEAYKRGEKGVDLDMFSYAASKAGGSKDAEMLRYMRASEKRQTADPIYSDNWLSWAVQGAAQMLPGMVKGVSQSMLGGAAAAGAVALAGQAGPQVALLEEPITVPIAFAVGSVLGGMEFWSRQGAGATYAESVRAGVDPTIATYVAHAIGPLYAAVETMQVKGLAPTALKAGIRKIAQGSVAKATVQVLAKYGINTLKEAGEEGVQEFIGIMGVEGSKAIDNYLNEKNIPQTSATVALKRSWNAFAQSVGPMALLGGGRTATDLGQVAGTVRADQNQRRTKQLLDTAKPPVAQAPPVAEGLTPEQEGLLAKAKSSSRTAMKKALGVTSLPASLNNETDRATALEEARAQAEQPAVEELTGPEVETIAPKTLLSTTGRPGHSYRAVDNPKDIFGPDVSTSATPGGWDGAYTVEFAQEAQEGGEKIVHHEGAFRGSTEGMAVTRVFIDDLYWGVEEIAGEDKDSQLRRDIPQLRKMFPDAQFYALLDGDNYPEIGANPDDPAVFPLGETELAKYDPSAPVEAQEAATPPEVPQAEDVAPQGAAEPLGALPEQKQAAAKQEEAVRATVEAKPVSLEGEVPAPRVLVSKLKLSEDVPNFKEGTDAKGVVTPLQSEKYNDSGTPPLQVWERLDGTLEVISGRHRLDLAQRTDTKRVRCQIYREADGFTAEDAAALDAQTNIQDGHGSVLDYARYFKDAGLTEEQAKRGGLLSQQKGRFGFSIGANAGNNLWALFTRPTKPISAAKAAAIAEGAPGRDEIQTVGIQFAQKPGVTADEVAQYMKSQAAFKPPGGEQLDLFGFDTSWQDTMEASAKAASSIVREKRQELVALNAASKLGKLGKGKHAEILTKYDIDPGDTEAVAARVQELKEELYLWNNWEMHPELKAQVVAKTAETMPLFANVEQAEQQEQVAVEEPAEAPQLDDLVPEGQAEPEGGVSQAVDRVEPQGEAFAKDVKRPTGRNIGRTFLLHTQADAASERGKVDEAPAAAKPKTTAGLAIKSIDNLADGMLKRIEKARRLRTNYPKVYEGFRRIFATPEVMQERTLEFMVENFGDLSKEQAALLHEHREDPANYPLPEGDKRMAEAAEQMDSLYDAVEKGLLEREIVGKWPESAIGRNEAEIATLEDEIDALEDPAKIAKRERLIAELEESNDILSNLRYARRLVSVDNYLERMDRNGSLRDKLRSSAPRLLGRKFETLAELKEAFGDAVESDARVALADLLAYANSKIAIYDFHEDIKANQPNLVRKKADAPAGWLPIQGIDQYKGYLADPMFVEAVHDFTDPGRERNVVGRLYDMQNSMFKQIKFYNMFIMTRNNIHQQFAAVDVGGILRLRKAAMSVAKRDSFYRACQAADAFSVPSDVPWPTYQQQARAAFAVLDDANPTWWKAAKRILEIDSATELWKILLPTDKNLLLAVNRRATWMTDRVMRVATAMAAHDRGMPLNEAIVKARNFHADYNLLGKEAGKWAGRMFLTPKYQYAMWGNLFPGVARGAILGKRESGFGMDRPEALKTAARITVMFGLEASLMAMAGYALVEGYRFVKQDEPTDEEKAKGKTDEEIVVLMGGPFSEPFKVKGRVAQGYASGGIPKALLRVTYNKLAVFPHLIVSLLQGRNWRGQQIFTKGAPPVAKALELGKFLMHELYPVFQQVDDWNDEKQETMNKALQLVAVTRYSRGPMRIYYTRRLKRDFAEMRSYARTQMRKDPTNADAYAREAAERIRVHHERVTAYIDANYAKLAKMKSERAIDRVIAQFVPSLVADPTKRMKP